MDDHIARIDQHPIGIGQAFDPRDAAALLLNLGLKLLRHRCDLTGRPATGDHHMVGNGGFSGKRNGDGFHRLIIFQ